MQNSSSPAAGPPSQNLLPAAELALLVAVTLQIDDK
jgi:hypothetical protein